MLPIKSIADARSFIDEVVMPYMEAGEYEEAENALKTLSNALYTLGK